MQERPRGEDHLEAGATAFSDVVWAHWVWEQQRHAGHIEPGVEREYHERRADFERRFGEITDSYWSISDASGVALTVCRQRSGWRPFRETVPRFHLSFDWATRHEPAIAQVLNECGTLAIRAGEVLRGSSELIALRRIVSVASHLLGYVDRTQGRPDESAPLAVAAQPGQAEDDGRPPSRESRAARRHVHQSAQFAAEKRKELAQIEIFYDRAGNKQARIVYFWGMVLGYLCLAPVTVASVLLIWLVNRLGGGGHLPWTQIRVLIVCIAAGPLGAILSVLTRIASSSGKFELDYEVGRKQTRWLGIVRPVLGAIFGVATYLLLASGILQTKEPANRQALAYYGALAFLSGFFERFLKVAPGGAPTPVEPPPDDGTAAPAAPSPATPAKA